MRLAQIARKVGLTPLEVKRFLESEFELTIGNEPNYKLDDNQINSVLEKFPIPIKEVKTPEVKEVIEEVTSEADTTLDEIEDVVVEIAAIDSETEIPDEVIPVEAEINVIPDKVVDEKETLEVTQDIEATESIETPVIENDTVEADASAVEISYEEPSEESDEDAPFVEVSVDREADLIKAPTVKLDGLKVLGKIELPREKVPEIVEKSEDDIAQEESDALAELDAAMQSQAQDIKPAKTNHKEAKETKEHLTEEETESEYKDNRGFYHFSAQQKLNREKAVARVELSQKRVSEKEKKKRHYQEVMKERKQKESVVISKTKQKKIETRKQKKVEKNIEPPKGLWAKFVHWLND